MFTVVHSAIANRWTINRGNISIAICLVESEANEICNALNIITELKPSVLSKVLDHTRLD